MLNTLPWFFSMSNLLFPPNIFLQKTLEMLPASAVCMDLSFGAFSLWQRLYYSMFFRMVCSFILSNMRSDLYNAKSPLVLCKRWANYAFYSILFINLSYQFLPQCLSRAHNAILLWIIFCGWFITNPQTKLSNAWERTVIMRQFILQKAEQGLSCGRWGSLSSSYKHFVQLLTGLQGATVQASMFKPLLNKSLMLLSLKQFSNSFHKSLAPSSKSLLANHFIYKCYTSAISNDLT